MNNMPPDLSGLIPYMIAFIAVAVAGAVVSLALISQAVATFALAKRRTRAARPDSVPAHHLTGLDPLPLVNSDC
jgi:hypothetical protein